MRKDYKLSAIGFAASLLCSVAPTYSEGIAVVGINSNQTLAWSEFDPSSQIEVPVSSAIGQAGDIALYGSFVSAGASNFGVVTTEDDVASTWRIYSSSGTLVQQVELGEVDDLAFGGADVDGNGILDPIYIESNGTSLLWNIRPNLFSSTPEPLVTHVLGKTEERSQVFVANFEGDGDWLGVVRDLKNSPFFRLRLRDVATGTQRSVKINEVVSSKERIYGLEDLEGKDIFAFVREFTAKTRVKFFGRNGVKFATYEFPLKGTFLKGDYDTSQPGEEVAVQDGDTLYTYNPFSAVADTFTVPDAILVDTINSGDLNPENDPSPKQCTAGTPGLCGCYMLDETDGYKIGFVYKRKSDTYGGVVVVLPNPCGQETTAVVTMDTQCNQINSLYDNGYGNPDGTGNRRHFKEVNPTYTGGWYRDNYGAVIFKLVGTGRCFLISNPAVERVD